MINLGASGARCALKQTIGKAEMQTQMLLLAAETWAIMAENVRKYGKKDMITISY